MRVIVLSDLHLGPGGPLTTFRDAAALAAFVQQLAASPGPIELILAGDIFDFLQIAGYEGLSAREAVTHLDVLLANPATLQVMAALRNYGEQRGHEITVLAGNHDPELLMDDVRERFAEVVGRRGTILFGDDTPLVPHRGEQPAVTGRALESAGRTVWVVHGDRWDPVNAIDREAVRAAAREGRPIHLPTGSHLVFEVLSRAKLANPWVDEVKPEFPAVLLLLLYLEPRTTMGFLRAHYSLTSRLLLDQVHASLRAGPLFGPPQVTASGESSALTAAIAEVVSDTEARGHDAFLAELYDYLERGPRPAPAGAILAAHSGAARLLLRAWLACVRKADRFQDLDGPDEMPSATAPLLAEAQHVAGLLAGHTHGARVRASVLPWYCNSGTWVPVARIPSGDLPNLIDDLESKRHWPAEAPRTFVELTLGDGPARARLGHCDARGVPAYV